MGGNAFKNVETRRIESREEFERMCNEIISVFMEHSDKMFSVHDIMEVKSYNKKSSFGDIDFLVPIVMDSETLDEEVDIIMTICKKMSDNIIKNGDVISFVYDSVQIDFILIDWKHYRSSQFFFNYNDVGLLLGKICYYQRLTLGETGLRLKVYDDEDFKILDENITSNPKEICNYLGLDYCRWKKGFDTMEQVFDFVMSSKFYDERAFNPDNWNASQRHRDTKRVNLKRFLDYAEVNKIKPRPTKEETFEKINAQFPEMELEEKRYEILKKKEALKRAKEKFNGHIVSEKFEIEKEELGIVMKDFYARFESETDRVNFINNNSLENIFKIIEDIIFINFV